MLAIAGDVCSPSDLARLVDAANEQWGNVDILVHAAGVLRPTPILELEPDEWDWVRKTQ